MSVVGPGGWGGAGAWAWVGKQFYVSGSGSRSANIYMIGHMWGLTSAAGAGSAVSKITLVVLDKNTGTKYTTIVYHKSAGALGWFEVNQDFNHGISVTLMAGRTYVTYILVETQAAVYTVGEAGADFGPQDGDGAGHVKYYSITIDF